MKENEFKKEDLKERKARQIGVCYAPEDKELMTVPLLNFLYGVGTPDSTQLKQISESLGKKEEGLTVITPDADFAEAVMEVAQVSEREVLYLNPTMKNCPTFNPLQGSESLAVGNILSAFEIFNSDSPQFFVDMGRNLLEKSIKVVKRAKGNEATFIDLHQLISGTNNESRVMLETLQETESYLKEENQELVRWFYREYYNKHTKVFEHCAGMRYLIEQIYFNEPLKRILVPTVESTQLNFDKIIEEGQAVVIMTSLSSIGEHEQFLGQLLTSSFSYASQNSPKDGEHSHFLYIDKYRYYFPKI